MIITLALDCSQPRALSLSVELFPPLQRPAQFYLLRLHLSCASLVVEFAVYESESDFVIFL